MITVEKCEVGEPHGAVRRIKFELLVDAEGEIRLAGFFQKGGTWIKDGAVVFLPTPLPPMTCTGCRRGIAEGERVHMNERGAEHDAGDMRAEDRLRIIQTGARR